MCVALCWLKHETETNLLLLRDSQTDLGFHRVLQRHMFNLHVFLLRPSLRTRSCSSGTETPTTPSWESLEFPEEKKNRARRTRAVKMIDY